VVTALAGAAGRDAAEIAGLLAVMTIGATVIWLMVTGLALHALRSGRAPWSERAGLLLIAVGGAAVPTLVLAALLAYGMPSLARQTQDVDHADVRLTVIGEQWWWRVRYDLGNGRHVELANEVRLPRDRIARVTLTSTNVIHSFWIPALAGKMDMIPGRITFLTLEPRATGVFRGVCAEYCGASHARMALVAEVMEPEAFDAWLAAQAAPAVPDGSRGEASFAANGCGACHAIRGTRASATIGPDLTHLGGRHTIAAATLPNDPAGLARWIARPDHVKPGVLMPPFGMLPPDDVRAIAEYLHGLR
jgi:cytochrome c oxidase subunit 2